uniref:Zinc finger, DBF-type containing 2 n=1 Tax=Nannospalax galili TaxID=1026970 RepID=A0A8C6QT13_NANGA
MEAQRYQEVMKNNGKHLFSAQHRSMTRQSRRQTPTNNNTLMERFLQDVLRHHPYDYQDNRSGADETEEEDDPGSPEVVVLDDSDDEDYDDAVSIGSSRILFSDDSESVEEIDCRPSTSRECAEIAVRPSVIQKLEGGQQQPLEVVHRIESGVNIINSVDLGQASTSGKRVIRPPVICNAPARAVPRRPDDIAVAANSVPRLVLAVASDSFPACDSENLDTYFDPPDQGPSNPSSQPKAKDPKKKPLNINLDKLLAQKNLRAKGAKFFPVVRVRELTGAELRAIRVGSSELAANAEANLNKTDTPYANGAVEGAIPKRREESRSSMRCTQEEKRLVLNKSALLKPRRSVSSEMKFYHGSRQPMPGPSHAAVRDLQVFEELVDQEDDSYETRASELSFDCGSSCNSPSAASELTAREINALEERHANSQQKNKKSGVSRITSDNNGNNSRWVVINPCPVIVRETPHQNAKHISLVDESYDSSDSETNFVDDDALPSTSDCPPESVHAKVHVGLVDGNYGVSSCEASDGSAASTAGPAAARQKKLRRKAQANLVDNYGSSSFEASSDSDRSPQMPVKERSLRDRPANLNNNQPSSARVHLETVADEPQRDAEEINLPQERNPDLGDMNCESHGPEMGFHADAQLVADQSQVAVEEVDLDLENQSVHSNISNLSFDSHAFYQSANNQPQGAWGEVNLNELNVDMEVKSSGCSSSELTFDSDSPLLSVTERSLLDVDEINEDDFNLEDESCESSSSDITFDSDIPEYSVVDQPQVAVYEEEPVGLENKSNESYVSEITFGSDILHSGNDHLEVAVEVIIQEEEHAYLERKSDSPSGSEINLDSNPPLHSVTNSHEVAVKQINPPKEEQAHIKNKEHEPTSSEPSLDCDTFNSKPGRSEDPIADIRNMSNVLCVSETRVDSPIPFPSVIRKCEVVVKNVSPQTEKHADLQGESVQCSSGSEKNSDSAVPPPVTEPYVGKKAKRKTKHLVETSDEYGDSELTFNPGVFPQLMTEKPQPAVLKKGRIDPNAGSAVLGGFEVNVNPAGCFHSAINQPQQSLKGNHVEQKDTNDKPGDSKLNFNSVDHPHSLPEQDHEMVKKMNMRKIETLGLNNNNELRGLKVIHDSDVSFRSAVDELEVALKQINLENNDQMSLENENSQNSCSEINLDSDFPVQSTVDPPKTTVLAPEHIELEGKRDRSCDSDVSFDSDNLLQSVADHPNETGEKISLGKDEDVDMEGKRDEAEGFGITHDSDVSQPVAGQTEVAQELNHSRDDVDLEDRIIEPRDSEINFVSDEPLLSVTNATHEPLEEMNLVREGHVSSNDKDCEPCGSGISVSNVAFCSVIQQPQSFQKGHVNLEVESSDACGPEMSFDSSDPCHSVPGHLQKTLKEMNLKEDHIYLEDKSYKLVDFEASYDSDDPVQFVTDPSVEEMSIKEVNLQKQDHIDLENENFQPCCSEVRYDSGVQLQSEIDPPQVDCEETNLQKKNLLDVEEKSSEPSDSEIVYDSDVSFQIVVNQLQTSDGEADSPEVVFVDVVSSDSDCDREVISDASISLELETEPPQMTVKEASNVSAESVGSTAVEKYYCKFCGYDYEASQSVTNQSKESFKIINRKNDYIILGDSTCPSCGHEVNFNVDVSDQSMICQSQGPDQNCVAPEDKNYESDGPERNLNLEDTSQPMIEKDPKNVGLRDRSWESGVCAVDRAAYAVSVIQTVNSESCGSGLNFQYNASLQSDTDQPEEPVKKKRQRKRVTFDLRVTTYEYIPSPVYMEEAEEVTEDYPDEPVLEASTHVPPSFIEEVGSQMREDDIKTNTPVQEFREGCSNSFYDGDSEAPKFFLGEDGNTSWSDFNQDTASIHEVRNPSDFTVALGEPSCSVAEGVYKQHWHVASPNQVDEGRRGTRASSGKKRKIPRQEEDSPKRKHLQNDGQKKKKPQIITEFPASAQASGPVQPDSLVNIFSSLSMKEARSFNSPKMKHNSCDNNVQFINSCKEHNVNDTLRKETVITSPQNLMVPDVDRHGINGGNRENLPSTSYMTIPKRSVIKLHRTSQTTSFLKNSEDVNASKVSKGNFQRTLSNRNGAKIFSKSVRNEYFRGKSRKKWRRKINRNKSRFIRRAYKTVVLQKKTRLTSEKLAIWIQMKATDIVRKYVYRYSGATYHRSQSRTTLIRMQLRKKKLVARRIKEVKRAVEVLRNASVLPASAEEQSRATTSSSQLPVRRIARATRRKHYGKNYYRRKKRLVPVREYDLRSSCYIPDADRMVTRRASKSRCNEAK